MNSSGSTNRFCAVPKWIPSPLRPLCCHCICGSNKLLMDSWSGTQLQADYWGRRTPGDWRPDWISTLTHRESVLQTRPSFQDHMDPKCLRPFLPTSYVPFSTLKMQFLYYKDISWIDYHVFWNKWLTESFLLLFYMCLFPYFEAQLLWMACSVSEWKDLIRDASIQRHSCFFGVLIWSCCAVYVFGYVYIHFCADLDTSVEYVCCSCFHLSFNNEPDVGWKYMCINIGIYRNLIHITWYVELEPCLPRKEAITKLMWAPDRELEAELGAFIFFHWSAIERRKKWKKESLLIRRNTLLNRSICFSHQTLFFFLNCSISLFLHP